jgi:predicted transcriptional regulator
LARARKSDYYICIHFQTEGVMAIDSAMERLVDEVAAIKKLIIYAMRKDGMTQDQIATVLGIGQSSVSRMLNEGGAVRELAGAKGKAKEKERADE